MTQTVDTAHSRAATEALFAHAADPALDGVRAVLERLALAPPQTLLLEGGSEAQRQDMARYWAAACNCPAALAAGTAESESRGAAAGNGGHAADSQVARPCCACPVCAQIAAGEYLDVLAYDGRISNREDEENPGPVLALTMRRARELKSRLRDAPHGAGRRVVLLTGLSANRDEAANALLKALEEPSAHTVFVLLAAQREQLLPTLVSRALTVTLPWPDSRSDDADCAPWAAALAAFLRDGRGFLDKAAARGALDADMAGRLVLACQKALARVLAGAGTTPPAEAATPLDTALARLAPHPPDVPAAAAAASQCSRWLDEAHEMIRYGVAPARVMEALASRLFLLLRR